MINVRRRRRRLFGEQITDLGLHPLVSLTDHDNIEAGVALQASDRADEVPISVEWTVPYGGSIFHLGIHNLPPAEAQSWMSAMMTYTAAQDEQSLQDILRALCEIPEVLVVLNHPFWLEEGIQEAVHQPALDRFLREHVDCLHAFELNGIQKWKIFTVSEVSPPRPVWVPCGVIS